MPAAPLAPPTVRPQSSPQLAVFVAVVHLAGAVAVMLSPIPNPIRLIMGAAIAGSLGYALLVHCWRIAPWAIREARQTPEGDWVIDQVSGAQISSVRLLASGCMGQRLLILNFRTGRFLVTRTLILTTDSVDPDVLRRLRASLKT